MDERYLSIEKIALRLMENGHSEDEAKTCAETYSLVSKFDLDAPITRRYINIHVELFENRIWRRLDPVLEELNTRLDRIECLLAALSKEQEGA